MVKPRVQLTLGFVVAVALIVAAVWLWLHNVIIVAAPVGALALGVAWAVVDNTMIYPAERSRRMAEATPDVGETPETSGIAPPHGTADGRGVTVPR